VFPLAFIPWFVVEPFHIPIPWVGEYAIQPFGLMVVIGIFTAEQVAERRAPLTGYQASDVADLVLWVMVPALILAYLLNTVFYHPDAMVELIRDPSRLLSRYQGLSSYGGIIGGAIGAAVWQRRRGISFFVIGDALAYAFPVGWMFGRTGCFMVHDHPGVVSDFFLAVDNYRGQGLPRHDLGLYEALWSLGMVIFFVYLGRRPRTRGLFLALLPTLYAPVRFGLDFLRATPDMGGDIRYLGLTPAQYGSIVLGIIGVSLCYGVYRRARLPEEAHVEAPEEPSAKDPSP
jgi:phosphatidylglycerol:prolipoprotein diacylglycerol transferase